MPRAGRPLLPTGTASREGARPAPRRVREAAQHHQRPEGLGLRCERRIFIYSSGSSEPDAGSDRRRHAGGKTMTVNKPEVVAEVYQHLNNLIVDWKSPASESVCMAGDQLI